MRHAAIIRRPVESGKAMERRRRRRKDQMGGYNLAPIIKSAVDSAIAKCLGWDKQRTGPEQTGLVNQLKSPQ